MPLTRDLRQSDRIQGCLDGRVPVFDVSALAGAEVRDACTDPGFFCIDEAFKNSPVLPVAWQQMAAFFGLDDGDPQKQAVNVARTGGKRGWTPQGGEPAYQPGTRSHLESFDFGRPGGSPANTWPDLPGFRHDMHALWNALSALGDKVLSALSVAAGLTDDALVTRCNTRELSTLRLLHYPPGEPADNPFADLAPAIQDVGIAAHTDFECMTLILQTAAGLELRDVRGNWYDAPSDERRVTVLLADMLECFTNGRFHATGHRVRTNRHRRYSIVMFFAVNDDEVVAPLAECIDPGAAPRYAPVRQREHLEREVSLAVANRDAGAEP